MSYKKLSILLSLDLLLVSFSTVFAVTPEGIDCANIEQFYQLANIFLKAHNSDNSNPIGVMILNTVVQKCKDNSIGRDNAGFAKASASLGYAYWYGQGVNKNCSKACEHYHEVLKNSATLPPEIKNEIENNARLALGDGAYWGYCQEKNWSNALVYYFDILAHAQNSSANTLAWAKGRIADAYRQGDGIEKNYTKSLELFQEIENDDQNISDKSIVAWAKYWKAYSYQYGQGVEQNHAQALIIFNDIVKTYQLHDPIAVEYAQRQIDILQSKQA